MILKLKLLKTTLAAFSTLFIFSTSIALSAELSLLTSIGLKQEYNDNILFNRSDEIDDYISYVLPGLNLGYTTEILDLRALANWEALFYWDNNDLDTINHRYGLGGKYKLTERWAVRVDGRYVKDTTLDSQLEETGRVGIRQDRDRLNAGAGVDYAISERSSIGTDYEYQNTVYERKSSVDTQIHTMSVFYQRRLKNQKDVLRLYPEFAYGTSDDYDAYNSSLNFRWSHPFSETLDTSILAGLRNTHVDYKDDRDNTTNWGGVADMWLRKRGEVTTGRVGFSNNLRTRDNGEILNVARLYTNIDHRLSRRFGVGIRGSIYYSNLIEDSPETDDDRWYFDVSPSAFYRITENHTIRLLYSYNQQNALDVEGDSRTERHRVWLRVDFNFPKSW